MRIEEWEQDQSGMISTAIVEVYEPGDRVQDGVYSTKDVVLVDYEKFRELLTASGYDHARTS